MATQSCLRGFILFLAGVLFCSLGSRGQIQAILTLRQSTQLPQASIWGGISFNGENISVTTTLFQGRPHLFLRKLERDLRSAGAVTQLTFDSDPETARRITDHKHIFLNGHHFIAFSVEGDSDLYVFKTDQEGRRVNRIVPVVEQTANRTNDMMFCTDGEMLYIAYFKPPDQSVIHILSQDLQPVQPPLVTSPQLPHNNLGGMVYRRGRFYLFTGDKAGPNSNLILTVWNHDWSPAEQTRRVLIPAPSGGGYFFATGIAFDESEGRWYLGFHHVQNANPDDTTHLDLAVFDENFNLLEHQHTIQGFRPHFLLLDGSLYSVYDHSGVFMHRYEVRSTPALSTKGFSTVFPSVTENATLSSGLAIVNPSDAPAHLTLSAFDNEGSLIRSGEGGNPLRMVLPARAQIARLAWQLFGKSPSTANYWIQLVSDLPDTSGFFLRFDPGLETLDGAGGYGRLLTYFVCPLSENAELMVVNPDDLRVAEVRLQYMDGDGREQGGPRNIRIAARGRYAGRMSDLLPAGAKESAGYMSILSDLGLATTAFFGSPGRHESALNALDANAGARVLLAPQYVSGGGYETAVTIVNLDNAATTLGLGLRDDNGQVLGREANLALPARGCITVGGAGTFGLSPTAAVQGYLRVTSTATRITGALQFGDSASDRFRTTLPLAVESQSEAVFPQIAQDSSYFTGIAVVNPNPEAAEVRTALFTSEGKGVGSCSRVLQGGGRFSQLLRELVPEMQSMSGGYIKLISSRPTAGFAVFGTHALTSLAAIPALVPGKSGFVGAAPADSYAGVNVDSDFAPPRGGVARGAGPAMFRLMIAGSEDGLTFRRTHRIVTDQGAVPDMVVDKEGVVYLYYTGWTVGTEINKTVVAISRDNGQSWTFKKLSIRRNEGETDLVDPDVLILDDGTFRLYTTIGDRGQYARSHYSDSKDGIRFERKGIAFDPGSQALDPSTIKIGATYHLFAGGAGNPEVNWHGTSRDGAVYIFDRQMTFKFNGFGQMMANGLGVDGGYRFFCFGNDRKGGITSFFTLDGIAWTADAGYRLMADAGSKLEEGQPTDPAVARLKDGSYMMVYSCRIYTGRD